MSNYNPFNRKQFPEDATYTLNSLQSNIEKDISDLQNTLRLFRVLDSEFQNMEAKPSNIFEESIINDLAVALTSISRLVRLLEKTTGEQLVATLIEKEKDISYRSIGMNFREIKIYLESSIRTLEFILQIIKLRRTAFEGATEELATQMEEFDTKYKGEISSAINDIRQNLQKINEHGILNIDA